MNLFRYTQLVLTAAIETIADQRVSLMILAEISEAELCLDCFLSTAMEVADAILDMIPDADGDDAQLSFNF